MFYRVLARRATKAAAQQQAALPGATLTATLADLGISAQGILVVASPLALGTLEQSLGILEVRATGGVTVLGFVSGTLGTLIGSAAATLRISGAASAALSALSSSAVSQLKITGSASNTLGAVTLSGLELATPTLSNYSTLGTAPVVLQWSSSEYVVGQYGQLQIATDSGFTSITQNIVFFIDGDSWARLDEDINLTTPSGTYYARIRTARDNESGATTVTGTTPDGGAISFLADVSAWSTTFTDTIAVSSAVMNTTNGVNKNAGMTVTGSPALTAADISGNHGTIAVRSTLEQVSSKAQFEITINSVPTATMDIGFDDGTVSLATASHNGGRNNSNGICIKFGTSATIAYAWNSSATTGTVVNTAGTIAVNDIFTFVLDTAAHTLEIWRTRVGDNGGLPRQMGSTLTSLPTLTHYYAYAGNTGAIHSVTFNFGATTYAKTPGTGVAAYWA